MRFNESKYEKLIIEYAVENGFKYISDEDVLAMRNNSLLEVILEDELREYLINSKQKLNNEMISQTIRKIKDLKGGDQLQSNKIFQKYIIEGIKIYDKKNKKNISVEIFNNKNNRLIVTNQFSMASRHPQYNKQIPDVVLFVNGLPVCVIELKSPGIESMEILEKAYDQIENYKLYLPSLFIYNCFNIISDGHIAKIGALNSSFSRYQNWRGKNFDDPEKTLFKDVFKEKIFIDLIKNYTFFTKGTNPKKIIAGYHQFYGVKAALKSIEKAMSHDKKGGIFWHTQGSGKSFSMLFLIKNFAQIKSGTTFIVITDRTDLENQLLNTFNNSSEFLRQKIQKMQSIDDLKKQLKDRKQDGIYFSTIQKFRENVEELIIRENVVIITDEAHRSHNNLAGKYETDIKDKKFNTLKFGNAKYLRHAFPNATFIGFTGTPIENQDKSTTLIFGKIISEYKMNNAEKDGVIVPIYYESRKIKLKLDEKSLNELDIDNQKINQYFDKNSSIPNEMKKIMKFKIERLENFIKDPDRINEITNDFIEHYETRKNIVKGKAIFVALNRHIALSYYKKIIEKKPEWKNKIKLIISNNNKQSDKPELNKLAGTSLYRKNLAIEFKKDDSEFKIAIVVDMWLTGFDVQSLDTIYLDKPIKMHNLMQAIARTNRVYNNKKEKITKEAGLVVDYIGLWSKLGNALKFYSGANSRKQIVLNHDINVLKKEYLKILNYIWTKNTIDDLKINIDKAKNDTKYFNESIEKTANHILDKKTQNKFIDMTKILSKYIKKTISVLNKEEKIKFHLLIVTRIRIIKLEMNNIDFMELKNNMLQKLENVIKYNKTIIIDNIKNNKINLKDIANFIDKKTNINKKLNTIKKVTALRFLILELKKINLIKAGKISDNLNNLMNQYESSHITLEQLQIFIIANKNEVIKTLQNEENDGMTKEMRGFYEIIENPIKQTNFDKNKIKLILNELLIIINNDQLVNEQWAFNHTLIKRTRSNLKHLLIKHNYPPLNIKKTRKQIIDQILLAKGMK